METNELIVSDTKLHEHYSFNIDPGQHSLRIDKYLTGRIPSISRNRIQNAIKMGNVYVNDIVVKSNYRVKSSDRIKVLLDYPQYQQSLIPENIPLNILYEDDDIIIVNKQAGLVVHPGHGNYSGTLLNGLIYHFNKLPLNKDSRPGLVHRLDKNTSGLLVVAKSENALTHLAKQFAEKSTSRTYWALVWGDVTSSSGTIDRNVGRNPNNRLQMIALADNGIGKSAVTHYKVLERFGYVTLIECSLETGRTHQIRVHMKHLGHTLFNDLRYGGNRVLKGTVFSNYKQFITNCFSLLSGQALHAKLLGFEHPTLGKWMSFDSELPDSFSRVLEKWKNYTRGDSRD